jgi:hypothetical protein
MSAFGRNLIQSAKEGLAIAREEMKPDRSSTLPGPEIADPPKRLGRPRGSHFARCAGGTIDSTKLINADADSSADKFVVSSRKA